MKNLGLGFGRLVLGAALPTLGSVSLPVQAQVRVAQVQIVDDEAHAPTRKAGSPTAPSQAFAR